MICIWSTCVQGTEPLEHMGLALTSNDSWRNSRYKRESQQGTLPRQQGPQSPSWAHFCFNIWEREENAIGGHLASDQTAQEQSSGHRHKLVLRGWEAWLSGLERLLLCICRETRADTRTFGSDTLAPFPTKTEDCRASFFLFCNIPCFAMANNKKRTKAYINNTLRGGTKAQLYARANASQNTRDAASMPSPKETIRRLAQERVKLWSLLLTL